jgi:two-component system LytT family response regulator
MKVFIIEDEDAAYDLLSMIIHEYVDDIYIQGRAKNIEESLKDIEKLKPDLIFLDVQLGQSLIFELLDQIDHSKYHIVFTTAYEMYAYKAFKYNAVDYLLKPYSPKEVIRVIEKIKAPTPKAINEQWGFLRKLVDHKNSKISMHSSDGITLCNVGDIKYCEADGAYCKVFLVSNEKLMISKSIGELESQLDNDQFVRVHTSHLVNLDHVRKFKKEDGGSIQMSDGCIIPVSRRKKQDFLDRIHL